jgi:DNA-binding transcriptional regulator YhcF (GntR family)
MNEPTPTATKAESAKKMTESIRKWGKPVIDAGFSIIPSVLFKYQEELELNAVDMNILLQLLDHWWKKSKLPMPSKKRLAKRLGVDVSTIRRHVAKLEGRNLIQRKKRFDDARGQRSNHYDLQGLVDALHPFAVRANKESKAKREAKKAMAKAGDN